MRRKHLVAGAVAIAALAGGTAGAVAATDNDRAAETSILADAARRLGVTPEELRSALSSAEDAQLADAVRAGRLTQAQADAIRERRTQEGTVLGLGHGGPGHGPGRGFGGPGGPGGRSLLADVARALGISERALFRALRDGRTLAALARANGRTLADVKAAVRSAAIARFDAALRAGRITQAQRDEAVERLGDVVDRLDDLGDGPFGGPGGFGGHGPGGDRGPGGWGRGAERP